ncbi:hypothetical protein WJX73_009663 [Symbiochloris irregularis]|uniref:Uncharacterized protein n=1 Tax=Symbiochloris irregularis TaxID=706552 RepID=A0AAW1P2T7_9CHLO
MLSTITGGISLAPRLLEFSASITTLLRLLLCRVSLKESSSALAIMMAETVHVAVKRTDTIVAYSRPVACSHQPESGTIAQDAARPAVQL